MNSIENQPEYTPPAWEPRGIADAERAEIFDCLREGLPLFTHVDDWPIGRHSAEARRREELEGLPIPGWIYLDPKPL